MTDLLHFEDFTPGAVERYPGPTLTAESIIAFAREWDPQPMHTDPEAAKASFVGGLIASGWQTACLHMRMITDGFLLRSAGMGSGGIDDLRWLKPVRPGDTLSGMHTVLDARPSASRPDRGTVRFLFEVRNQDGTPVMTLENGAMFARRQPGGGSLERAEPPRAPEEPGPVRPLDTADAIAAGLPSFDEVAIGECVRLGERRFTADGIKAFATLYDPQPFHVDEAAAARSQFGGLIASGWHTAASVMPLLVNLRLGQMAASEAAGRTPPRLGPSPGVRRLRWLKPVRAGDTITYVNTVTEKRKLQSRPGWGMVNSRTDGFDQAGLRVFTMDGGGLWEAA